MNYKFTTLFDTNQLIQRPIPEQRAFELEYYHFLVSLPKIMDEAFDITRNEMLRKHPLSINRSWFANTMNGNLIYLLGTSYPDYLKNTGRGSYCLLMNYRYEGYVKKLTGKKLFPSYNHSKTSRALTNQEALPEQEPIPVIYIGYTINKTNDNITGYYAVCIKGKERLWRTDLTAIEPPAAMPVLQTPVHPVTPLVTVKVKDRKKTG